MQVLLGFRAEFDKKVRIRPSKVVDELALEHGWWTRDSQSRRDAIIYTRLEEVMKEDEWVPRQDLVTEEMDLSVVEEIVQRKSDDFVCVGDDGVTFRYIWETSKKVAQLVTRMMSDPLKRYDSSLSTVTLTDEQIAVRNSVLGGNRITLCCSPAGTGKTHTATCIASEHVFVKTYDDDDHDGHVLCVTPTHKALNVLRSKLTGSHIEFRTIQSLMKRTTWVMPARLVIVDETSMLTMRQIFFLLTSYQRSNTRILFLGDDVQLPCIGRGISYSRHPNDLIATSSYQMHAHRRGGTFEGGS